MEIALCFVRRTYILLQCDTVLCTVLLPFLAFPP